VITIPAGDIDRLGLHVCNVAGMRRALAQLTSKPGYVLTDGFPVRGLTAPALAMWKGDQVAACVAAASVIAKVTRDALMCELDKTFSGYGFARHKGYSTRSHMQALDEHGPCAEHRKSFVNVRGRLVAGLEIGSELGLEQDLEAVLAADLEPGLEELEPGQGLMDAELGPDCAVPGPDKSKPANSCYPSGTGQNGPIVDTTEEHGWPTAGIAAMARGV
jgi:Ribonuclease HII